MQEPQRILNVIDLGLIRYQECLTLQKELVDERLKGKIGDTLLLLEHTPVITIGTAGGEENFLTSDEIIARAGVEIHKTDRGGNITYHGPGQLVAYPIFDLRQHGKDVHLLLRNLEQVVLDFLADYGIVGKRMQDYTGVWVDGDKICSIGIAVRRWVSYHGLALNISPDFGHWSLIHPCGLVGRRVTSLSNLIKDCPSMEDIKKFITAKFARIFEFEGNNF